MPGIYSDQHCDLSELLKRASHDEGGATLLIPDLQRPYVWTPTQVRLLVDSLIRGWPFGTFLTWRVKDSDPVRALARPFWQLVDRTGDDDGNENMPMQPPSSFQMVLDGQQRIQSLLLAVGGDAWGFKLYDREWAASLSGEKLKSGANHWSVGTLCVDLDKLVGAYATGKGATSLDYTQILQWVITGPDAQSGTKKKKGYNEPLAKALGDDGSHKYIRLSRLWNASVGADVDLRQAEQDAADFLTEKQGLPAEKVEQSKGAVASLLTVLGRVKAIRVTYLELAEFKGNPSQREEYNDAVVNIFTRLNTAGRTLTREDITFAWLKTNWIPEKTNGQSPTQCFESLVESLEAEKLSLNIEQLVGGVSFVWASLRNGSLLTNSDLLDGATIRPMASDLSENWDGLTASFIRATQIIRDHGYRFHEHYDSLNSIFVVWTWQQIADQWAANHKLKEIAKDSYEKATAGVLRDYLDRWVLCSQWAGRWAIASAERISGFSKRLFECSQAVKSTTSPTAAVAALRAFFEAEVKDLEADATNAVQSLSTPKRELVRIYYTHLFIWHRLNKTRWEMSQIALRTSNRRKTHLNVDHSVAYALWERKLIKAGHVKDSPEMNQILVGVNELGNCALLERDFNISKSDGTLESFLSQVHEFATKEVSLPDWAAAMALPPTMLDPDSASVEDVSKTITERTKLIRDDLSDFIAGKKSRVDL